MMTAGATSMWVPVPEGGVEAHALRLVFSRLGPLHPLAQAGKHVFRPFEVEQRADGLRVPTLADLKITGLPEPPRVVMPERYSIRDLVAPAEAAKTGGYYRDPPMRRRDRKAVSA